MEARKAIIENLSEEVQQELKDGAEFVQNAKYPEPTEDYSTCDEVEPLVERFPKTLALLSSEQGKSETRMTAVRFNKPQEPATLPVIKGATMILIPIFPVAEIPKVSSEKLAFGKYARVDAEELVELTVEGATYCLLLLCQGQNG